MFGSRKETIPKIENYTFSSDEHFLFKRHINLRGEAMNSIEVAAI